MHKDRFVATGLSLLAAVAVGGGGCGVEGDEAAPVDPVNIALITSAKRVSTDGKYTVNLTNTDPNLPDATITTW